MTSTAPRTIVVGIDGSDASLAIAFGSTHELQNASLCLLDNEVAAARRDTGCPVTVTMSSLHGRPASALVERSRTASLLVVGSNQHTTFRQAVFGTVATACRNHAACTVVVVAADGTTTWHHRSPVAAAAV
jgi:hypothetical protein